MTEAKLNRPATQIAPRRPNRPTSVTRSVTIRPIGAPKMNGAPTKNPNSHVLFVRGRSLMSGVDVESEAAVATIGLPKEFMTSIAAPEHGQSALGMHLDRANNSPAIAA